MASTIKARIQNKHDLEVNWLQAMFVPLAGELIVYDIEIDNKGKALTKMVDGVEVPVYELVGRTAPYTYERFKIGDGISRVNELPFFEEVVKENCVKKDINGNVVIQGNLQVNGITTTIKQENLTIKNNYIAVNADGTTLETAGGAGVIAVTGGENVLLKTGSYKIDPWRLLNFLGGKDSVIKNQSFSTLDVSKFNDLNLYSAYNFEGIQCYMQLSASDKYLTLYWKSNNDVKYATNVFDLADGQPSVVLGIVNTTCQFENRLFTSESDVIAVKSFLVDENGNPVDESCFTRNGKAYAAPIYDRASDSLKIGLGNYEKDENGDIVFEPIEGQMQSIATRADFIDDGALIAWDDSSKKLVKAGSNMSWVYIDKDLAIWDSEGPTIYSTTGISSASKGCILKYPTDKSMASSETIATREWVEPRLIKNLKDGEGSGSLQQKVFADDYKNPKATGLGAIAFGGFRGDKPNNVPDDEDTTTTAEGIQSFAVGAGNHAYGNWSIVMGKDNRAYQRASVALGAGCVAGNPNDPTGTSYGYALAQGSASGAFAWASAAFNNSHVDAVAAYGFAANQGTVSAPRAAAFGTSTASGENSFSAGDAKAEGLKATAFNGSTAHGILAFSAGTATASAEVTAAFGNSTASAAYAFSTGDSKASGFYSVALGVSDVSGQYSFGVGGDIKVKAGYSGAIGNTNIIDTDGVRSFAAGYKNNIYKRDSIVLGNYNNANGERNFIFGDDNTANHNAVQLIGNNLITEADNQTIVGKYNNQFSGDPGVFVVGCGDSSARKNALTIWESGNAELNGKLWIKSLLSLNATATMDGSIAFGGENTVNHPNAIAVGYGLKALSSNSAVFGRFNDDAEGKENVLLAIGNGYLGSRSNAFEVLSDGRAKVYSAPVEDNDIIRLQDIVYSSAEDIKSVVWG